MNRAQRRKLGIKGKKPNLEKKIGLFDKLPDKCTNCDKPYDKKSKEMAMTWSVVVREQENKVNLYCPVCWSNAHKLIAQIKEELNENKIEKNTP
jgi:Zn finger protein HypA/HybF involved in hydrogenase expression